jgi:hypothetical protein
MILRRFLSAEAIVPLASSLVASKQSLRTLMARTQMNELWVTANFKESQLAHLHSYATGDDCPTR